MNHSLIREMIQQNAMELYGQPKWTFGKNTCNTYEVFVGKIHLADGEVMPAWPVMAIIEKDAELSKLFSAWFLQAAMKSAMDLTEETDCNVTLAVDLLPAAANVEAFADQVIGLAQKLGMNPQKLQFQLKAVQSLTDVGVQNLNRLHDELGVGLWLSGFGAGTSNVDLLRDVHFDGVDLDASYAALVPEHEMTCRLVVGIQHLLHTLDLQLCVKGIETQDQFEFFEELDCHKGDGELIGKAMKLAEIKEYIAKFAVKRGHA